MLAQLIGTGILASADVSCLAKRKRCLQVNVISKDLVRLACVSDRSDQSFLVAHKKISYYCDRIYLSSEEPDQTAQSDQGLY